MGRVSSLTSRRFQMEVTLCFSPQESRFMQGPVTLCDRRGHRHQVRSWCWSTFRVLRSSPRVLQQQVFARLGARIAEGSAGDLAGCAALCWRSQLGRLDDAVVRAPTRCSLDDVAGKDDKSLRYGERGWRWAQTANDSSSFCSPTCSGAQLPKGMRGESDALSGNQAFQAFYLRACLGNKQDCRFS